MPTAPTLNRTPKAPAQPKLTSFAPSSFDKPPTGGNSQVRDAAVNSAMRSGQSQEGLSGQVGFNAPVAKSPPKIPSAPKPQQPSVTYPKQSGNVGFPKTPGAPSQTVHSPTTPGTGNTQFGFGNPSAAHNPTLSPSTGAPPGTPDTGAQFTVPLLPQDEASIASANQAFGDAQAAANYGMGQAAFAYGDPTQMARFGVGAINPNSALAIAALKAQQQQEAAINARGRSGTLDSSLALEDQGRIGASQQRADLAGNVRYQQALARFNQAMVAARTTRDTAVGAARADERATALKNLPTANTASGGAASSTATGSKSIASKGGSGGSATGKTPKAGKTPTVKGGTVPKTSKAGKPTKSSSTVKSVPKTSVQKPTKVGGRKK